VIASSVTSYGTNPREWCITSRPVAPPSWEARGPWLVQQPAAAMDAHGRVVLTGLGPDARPRTTLLGEGAAWAPV